MHTTPVETFDADAAIEVGQAFIFHAFGINLHDGTGMQVDEETKREMQMLFLAGAAVALQMAAKDADVAPAWIEAAERFGMKCNMEVLSGAASNDAP